MEKYLDEIKKAVEENEGEEVFEAEDILSEALEHEDLDS